MIQNKKALSGVVTTLIIILLVIVAIGIIWAVINPFIGESVEQIGTGTKCLDVSVKATALVNTVDTNYDVTLSRTGTGDEIGGEKLVFFNASGDSSSVIDFGLALDRLETKTQSILEVGISNVNKIELTVYFTDDSGNEQLCPQSSTFNF